MGQWDSAPTRGNFLLKKEKLRRELIFLNHFLAFQLWSFPLSEFAVMLGTSFDLSVPIGDAFGSAKIPGANRGNVGILWRLPPTPRQSLQESFSPLLFASRRVLSPAIGGSWGPGR